jgi:hypothetical protein
MSDLIDEIKEDLRLDHFIKFFKKYANYIIGIALIVCSVSISYLWWQHSQEKQRYVLASQFEKALNASEQGNSQEANSLLSALEKESSIGYRTLAYFKRAMLAPSAEAQAILYKEIMEDLRIEPKFRGLATVLWAYLTVDNENEQLLYDKLQSVTDVKNPWKDSAQELLALLDLRTGNTRAAVERLKILSSDENVASGIRVRAFALLEQLGQ